jgi:hypothetical protein
MAAYNKFNQFTKDLIDGVHDFDAHTFKVMLTNVAPVATNTVRANITEISAGNGYTAGGLTTAITTSTASGVAKITATDVTFTATGGSIATFRYVVIYNDTPTSPLKPLMCWIDYGSAVTLAAGESLLVDFDATNGLATVA